MSKIYFYDTGLVCALFGIQNAAQLNYHPLFGSLFENMVISEMLKNSYNKAKSSNLFFWRDNVGHEVDILIESGENLYPVEIKSGRTISDEFYKGIVYWCKISGEPGGTVVYAGESHQKRSTDINEISWKGMRDLKL